MFGFKKKENKPLLIMGTDVIEIIKSDYEEDMAFALIEFLYDGKQYTICLLYTSNQNSNYRKAECRKEQLIECFVGGCLLYTSRLLLS